jgi:hypothetical protein
MLRKLGRILYLLTPFIITVVTVDTIRDNHRPRPEPAALFGSLEATGLLAARRP